MMENTNKCLVSVSRDLRSKKIDVSILQHANVPLLFTCTTIRWMTSNIHLSRRTLLDCALLACARMSYWLTLN